MERAVFSTQEVLQLEQRYNIFYSLEWIVGRPRADVEHAVHNAANDNLKWIRVGEAELLERVPGRIRVYVDKNGVVRDINEG